MQRRPPFTLQKHDWSAAPVDPLPAPHRSQLASWTKAAGAVPMTAVMTMSITIKKPQYGGPMAQQSRNCA